MYFSPAGGTSISIFFAPSGRTKLPMYSKACASELYSLIFRRIWSLFSVPQHSQNHREWIHRRYGGVEAVEAVCTCHPVDALANAPNRLVRKPGPFQCL